MEFVISEIKIVLKMVNVIRIHDAFNTLRYQVRGQIQGLKQNKSLALLIPAFLFFNWDRDLM